MPDICDWACEDEACFLVSAFGLRAHQYDWRTLGGDTASLLSLVCNQDYHAGNSCYNDPRL